MITPHHQVVTLHVVTAPGGLSLGAKESGINLPRGVPDEQKHVRRGTILPASIPAGTLAHFVHAGLVTPVDVIL